MITAEPSNPISGATQTLPRGLLDSAPTIERYRAHFDEARSDTYERWTRPRKCRGYFDGPEQISDDTRQALFLRGQPPIYTNRVRPAINGVLGVLEAGRRDPRAVARNPDDEDSADVATKALRFINDKSKFNDTQIDVAENFLIEGTAAVIVEMDGEDITPTQIRWEEFYYDPYSRRADLKDARYMGIAKWKDASEIREKYDVRINEIGDPLMPVGMGSDAFDDRPGSMSWVDRKRRRVMLIEEYALERGRWMRIVYIAAGVLEYGVSPYLDGKKRPCNPVEPVSCYVDNNNRRYGIVDDMLPIQDEVNSARSRNTALGNTRQLLTDSERPPMVSATVAMQEAAKHDGVIPAGYQLAPTTDMQQSNLIRAQEAKGEIERMGPTPAVLGRMEGGDQSGRARLVSQQAGLTELARPLGKLHGWVLRVYEQMWWRAQQFWVEPMWIRVTDDVNAPEFLKVNEPVPFADAVEAAIGGDKKAAAAIEPMAPGLLAAAQSGDIMAASMLQQMVAQFGDQPVMVKNALAELDMDLILDQDDDTANLAQEVWGELMGLLKEAGGLQAIFTEEFATAIELSPMSGKRQVIERLKAKKEEREKAQAEQAQAQAAQAEKAGKIAEAVTIADVAKTQADTKRIEAETAQTETETALDAFQAGLNAGPVSDESGDDD